ncbi:hypothetical protein Sj15T_00710 [Sphingobium sp. TA15]|uniref:Uncharacterized protein n=1 Tax=Sphingobium indicum (strain DSM 16413 / CCM 7287 / MTCC 6362 / UT26 / NBRC 101211 / UT26S) TaxID=452662 RepID=D4YZE0_SPHIU|nr:hypothetical protein [Sphingobium indicum]BAI95722.1 hypothetical protein SJA_C1-08880 [Sphingobium indicum UT26S]BDD65050.1 hypothetical protein Sj15T_00710 [Sphingobium sp. TA15]
MSIPPDDLTRKALLALEELCGGKSGVFERTMALRFVLAFLYSVSKSKRREPFDELWHGSGFRHPHSKELDAICRDAHTNSKIEGIYRAVGVHRNADFIFYKNRQKALQEERRRRIESGYGKR